MAVKLNVEVKECSPCIVDNLNPAPEARVRAPAPQLFVCLCVIEKIDESVGVCLLAGSEGWREKDAG